MNNHCIEREQLKRYLQGWTDEATSNRLEKHLSDCPECDQTLSQLDFETSHFSVFSGTPSQPHASISEKDESRPDNGQTQGPGTSNAETELVPELLQNVKSSPIEQ